MKITEKIKKEFVFFDGGTGTILQSQGLKPSELPEMWNIEKAQNIIELHKSYI